MFSDLWTRLFDILESDRDLYTVYVYRMTADGEKIKPYLLKCIAYPGLLDMLRDYHGGGKFRLMIRKGRILVYSEKITIGMPLRKA